MAWINNFLPNRPQTINIGLSSISKPVTCGVIQGSILKSLLFTINIDSPLNSIEILILLLMLRMTNRKPLTIFQNASATQYIVCA